jgi:hypothetical protein
MHNKNCASFLDGGFPFTAAFVAVVPFASTSMPPCPCGPIVSLTSSAIFNLKKLAYLSKKKEINFLAN